MAKSNGPVLVVIAALVVVGAGAAGWFLFNKSDPAVVAEPTPSTPAPTAKTTTPTKAPALSPIPKVTDSTGPRPTQRPGRDYIVDGKVVHDHRPEGTPPIDLPPAIHPPDGRKLRPESTGAITKAVREMMRECVAAIPAAERTGKPKMESTIVVAVKDKTATITKASVQLRDITGPSGETARACIESKAVGLATPVDEADVERYDITTSLMF